MSYEYVSKKEYAPARKEIEDLIKKLHSKVRKLDSQFTFEHKLIGSGSRHLITRVIEGNKGFDFDYNLILNVKNDIEWDPEYAKQLIMRALYDLVKGTNFDYPENSKSAITLKVKDTKNSRILHSVDLAIIYYPEDIDFNGYMYVKVIKNNGELNYKWEMRPLSHNIDLKLDWLKNNVLNYWNEIRQEYLSLKNLRKNYRKNSFSLYLEAVNNVYNWY